MKRRYTYTKSHKGSGHFLGSSWFRVKSVIRIFAIPLHVLVWPLIRDCLKESPHLKHRIVDLSWCFRFLCFSYDGLLMKVSSQYSHLFIGPYSLWYVYMWFFTLTLKIKGKQKNECIRVRLYRCIFGSCGNQHKSCVKSLQICPQLAYYRSDLGNIQGCSDKFGPF